MKTPYLIVTSFVGALAFFSAPSALADSFIETYVAHLSNRDHFNSNGKRLRTAAAILRQDRANVHRFGRRDEGDERDGLFHLIHNREVFEQLIERGSADPAAINAIVNGTPYVRVTVFKNSAGYRYLKIDVLETLSPYPLE